MTTPTAPRQRSSVFIRHKSQSDTSQQWTILLAIPWADVKTCGAVERRPGEVRFVSYPKDSDTKCVVSTWEKIGEEATAVL